MKTKASKKNSEAPKTYAGLVAMHVPRPIRDNAGYENAVEMIDLLAGHKLNQDQDDYLEIMARVVEDYERETVPEPTPVPGIESLRFLLSENGLTGEDLGKILGVTPSIAHRILKGSRRLTADHIKKLSARFRVSADLLLA